MHYNDQGADFKYLIVNERDKRFGLSVTTVGFQAIRAGSVYPPRNHPDAYYFTAQKGRVLHEYQLVYILAKNKRYTGYIMRKRSWVFRQKGIENNERQHYHDKI